GVDAEERHAALGVLGDDALDLARLVVVAEDARPGHDRDAALLRLLGQAVAVETGVADDDLQVELVVQDAERGLDDLIALRGHEDRDLAVEERLEVLQAEVELRLRGALAGGPVVPVLDVALADAELLADDVVHAHATGAHLAALPLRVAGLGDLEHAGEADQHLVERAGAGLPDGAPAAHVRAAAGDEADFRDAACHRDLEQFVVRLDHVEDAQLGVGLVDHLVDVATGAAADVAVDVHQAGHGELVAVVEDGVAV